MKCVIKLLSASLLAVTCLYSGVVTAPSRDYFHEIAHGNVAGASIWNKFGYNPDVDTGSEEIVSSFGGTESIMETADTLDVVSDSASDDSAGTGARTIQIIGIGEGSVEQTEIVTMNGLTPVTTTNTWLGVNRLIVLSAGTGERNAGTITIDDTSNSVGIQASIPAGDSVTQQCIFHTPVGKTFMGSYAWINILKVAGGGSPRVTIRAWSYSRLTDVHYEVFRADFDTAVSNTNPVPQPIPFAIGGREVLYWTAETDTNNTVVVVRFGGTLEVN